MSSKETGATKSKKRKADAAAASVAAAADADDDSNNNNNNIADINSSSNNKKPAAPVDRLTLHAEIGYSPLTLQDIHDRIQNLCRRIPSVPESGFFLPQIDHNNDSSSPPSGTVSSHVDTTNNNNKTLPSAKYPSRVHKTQIREWATAVQTVLEEFHLLISCVSPATYANPRVVSGAADQNLSFLSAELVRSQEQILARVTPRLNDVLAPVVTLLTDKTVTTKQNDGTEIKQNYFVTTLEDPDYVDLCYTILARNAPLLRQVVLANFDKLLQAIQDYLAALHKDSQHDSRGFVY